MPFVFGLRSSGLRHHAVSQMVTNIFDEHINPIFSILNTDLIGSSETSIFRANSEHPENEGKSFLRNVGNHARGYKMSQQRRSPNVQTSHAVSWHSCRSTDHITLHCDVLTWLFMGSVLIWHMYMPRSSSWTFFTCRFHVEWSLWDTETRGLWVITWSCIAWIAFVSAFTQPT